MSEKGMYRIFEQTKDFEGEQITQYGIEFFCGSHLNRVEDISDDLEFVKQIHKLLIEEDVCEETALDVITDCVIERYSLI